MKRALGSLCLWLGLVPAACTGAGERQREPADVSRALAAERFGDLAQAERELAVLFLDEVPRARAGEVFWAGWFLAGAHARLAFQPASPAHAQAALYYARRARLALDAAPDRPPADLDFPGNRDDAALGLDLLELAIEGQLGFDERVARMVDANGELARPGGARRLAEAARLDARLTARVELALWRHGSKRDGQRAAEHAFELAVGVLAASDGEPGLLGRDEVARLEAWIRSRGPFRCPECRQAAVPELRACPNDQTPLGRFQLEPQR